MPYRSIHSAWKREVLNFHSRHDSTIEETADLFNIAVETLEAWIENSENYGDVSRRQTSLLGRPSLMTPDIFDDVCQLLIFKPDYYLVEIQEWILRYHHQQISISTIARTIQRAGFTRKILHRIAAQRNELARFEWRRDVQSQLRSDQIVCIDESSKNERTLLRRYGRAPRGHRATIIQSYERGDRLSILPAMTVEGYIAVRVVEGSVNGEVFEDFVVEDVVCFFIFNISCF